VMMATFFLSAGTEHLIRSPGNVLGTPAIPW
jgi:hypothetical protein